MQELLPLLEQVIVTTEAWAEKRRVAQTNKVMVFEFIQNLYLSLET